MLQIQIAEAYRLKKERLKEVCSMANDIESNTHQHSLFAIVSF